MSNRGNLCSPFGFLKQVPRHLTVDVLPLEQAFLSKGQMEDDMLVRGNGRIDLGNKSGLSELEREFCE